MKTFSAFQAQLAAEEFILSRGSSILDDNAATLYALDIEEGATLGLNARLLGGMFFEIFEVFTSDCDFYCSSAGKVHGSLARAGKVRAQTPKVDKQEKKKKKCG